MAEKAGYKHFMQKEIFEQPDGNSSRLERIEPTGRPTQQERFIVARVDVGHPPGRRRPDGDLRLSDKAEGCTRTDVPRANPHAQQHTFGHIDGPD